ncbi:MFS transporter [Flavobacteriaceae bacterium TP-CH-4]|uniref:MFS transporter n=1 Tax=Pelagihabitans pacificus TaxID=2696054 RepID=A0A967ATB4_9FLAO|nr:MFS transporter [Pelagihabitans pacificus]NHF58825.1 MFS transporter [Pelagihabitans pacificus]
MQAEPINKPPLFPVRFKMVFGTFLLAMIVLFDRILLSVAKDPVAESLQLSDKQMGWAMSIFALGYALFQTPAGLLADKYGPRKVLTAVVALWSLFTALTGAVWNYAVLMVVRFLFGAGEAGAFPGMARAIYSWIPLQERGIVNGINFSGGRIGAAFALPMVAWLIDAVGWRLTFVILGGVGLLWGLVWYIWFRDNPEDHRGMSGVEVAYIQSNTNRTVGEEKNAQIDFSKLFKSKTMWLLMGQYFASNFTFFFCLTWLFPHLKVTYNLDALEAGFYASAPLIFGALGNWFSGFLVDLIYKRNKWALSRKIPAIIGFLLASTGIVASVYMEEVTPAIVFISMAVFGADMTLSPSWSACVDVGKQFSGAVSGTMNMAGNIGSFLTALAFPYLLDVTGSEVPFFYLAAGLNVLAIFVWMAVKPQNPLEITIER